MKNLRLRQNSWHSTCIYLSCPPLAARRWVLTWAQSAFEAATPLQLLTPIHVWLIGCNRIHAQSAASVDDEHTRQRAWNHNEGTCWTINA